MRRGPPCAGQAIPQGLVLPRYAALPVVPPCRRTCSRCGGSTPPWHVGTEEKKHVVAPEQGNAR